MQIGMSWVNTNSFPPTLMLCLLSKLLITVGLPITFCLQRECDDHSFMAMVNLIGSSGDVVYFVPVRIHELAYK